MKMWKKIKKFFIDWVWQLPQNLLGVLYKLIILEDISHEMYSEAGDFHLYLKESNGGVTLGKYVFVYRRYNNLSHVVTHESGHVIQSRILGPLYLIVIGIPSILWAATHNAIAPQKSYYWFYTERWANKLAGIK